MKPGYFALIIICFLTAIYRGQDSPNAVPTIRLDKTRFVEGEQIGFWLGVKQMSSAPIPAKYQESCRVTITRPDGTQKTEKVSWPIDGPPDTGWTGGWGLGTEPAQIGRYKLVFEFAGQKTDPAYLFVDDIPILKRIKVDFVFGNAGNPLAVLDIKMPTDQYVTFLVRNDSDQTIRFPSLDDGPRSDIGPRIGVSIRQTGKYSADFPFSENKNKKSKPAVGSISHDKFNWDVIGKVPVVTLKPGEAYKHKLSLQAALYGAGQLLSFVPGEFSVTFSTSVPMLIGEKNGQWAERSPFSVRASSTATCIINR
ncbi:MAG: hypothetical protein ABIO36_05325 [Pyrinomonadaceae bacterium]